MTLQEVAVPNNNIIRYSTPEDAFKLWKKQDGTEKTRTFATAARHKRRLIDKVDKAIHVALNDCNTEQKSIIVHEWLKKSKEKEMIDSIQIRKEAVEVTMFNNVTEVLEIARKTHRTNDSRSF